MRAGRLRHRVSVQQATTNRDLSLTGQLIKTWATVATCWAAVEPIKVDERMAAQGPRSTLTHRVLIRHRSYPTLSTKERFLYGSRVLEIAAVTDTYEMGRELVCECREVQV